MNEDGPPAQTDLHKHGMLIKDQLYNNVHLSWEMKGLPECVPCTEIRNYPLTYMLFPLFYVPIMFSFKGRFKGLFIAKWLRLEGDNMTNVIE